MYLRDTYRVGNFYIGDQANALVARAAVLGFSVTQQQVFDAVGRFCGKSGRTVRYYAETAAFYSEETRDRYDMLPFSHFVVARSLSKVCDWEAVLDYGASHPNISANGLKVAFSMSTIMDSSGLSYTPDPDGPPITAGQLGDIAPSTPGNYRILTVISGVMEGLAYLESMVDGGEVKLESQYEFMLKSGVRTLRTAIKVLCEVMGVNL